VIFTKPVTEDIALDVIALHSTTFSFCPDSERHMHDCLHVSEIIRIICDELYLAGLEGSLARLARTCRVIQDPALDVLWNELCDLTPLLKCMPTDAWDITDNGVVLVCSTSISPWFN
jgi:hypothetical protein